MHSIRDSDAVELEGVVDDDAPRAKGWDLDSLCAYRTFRVVRIQDRYLGLLYWFIVFLVLFFVFFVQISLEGKHQKHEPGVGTIITKFSGKAFAKDKQGQYRAFDEADLRFPEIEPQGAFVTTRVVSVAGQREAACKNYDQPCPCSPGQQCSDGFCVGPAWCPSLGDGNLDASKEGINEEVVQNLGKTRLEIRAAITFPEIGNEFFVAGKTDPKNKRYESITLEDLLAEGDISMSDVEKTGALIGVSFLWSCDVAASCEPHTLQVSRLDKGKGFSQRRARHYVKDGKAYRDAMVLYGVRIMVTSAGIGHQVSVVLIVIQVGLCLALLRTASMASDFMMLKLYSKVRRDKYYFCKVQETKDYSDLQDRLNLIEQSQEAEGLLRRGGLGMGQGGRGGLASAILSRR